jgi:hypothetical protein
VRLQSVDAINTQGSVVHFELDEEESGFSVSNIEGLDPVAASISSGNFANLDGEQYYSARRQKRNIRITLSLDPDFATADVKTLRDQLYAYFMPKSAITLKFNMFDRFATTVAGQTLSLYTEGRVESFDSALFTKDPQVVISVLCFDPDFVDRDEIVITDLLNNGLVIDYPGTTPTGILLTVAPVYGGEMSYFGFTHVQPDGVYKNLDVTWSVSGSAQHAIEVCSIPGQKRVTEIGPGGSYSQPILYAMNPASDWFFLQPGHNEFQIAYDGDPGATYKMQYTTKYGGL